DDGTNEQRKPIDGQHAKSGTSVSVGGTEGSYYAASVPGEVARGEDGTYICSVDARDAGAHNYRVAQAEMKQPPNGLFDGSMRGRAMYVIPLVMGHAEADQPMFGIEVTDSPYVVLSMLVMARSGKYALDAIEAQDAEFVECVHS